MATSAADQMPQPDPCCACCHGGANGPAAGAHACRVQELDTVPSSFPAGPQGQSAAVLDSLAQTLALHPSSDGPQRVVAKFPAQLYGQFEVSARVSVHPSTITSIDVGRPVDVPAAIAFFNH